jgi:hypothetical protein
MAKNCIIDLPLDVVERASDNANRLGKSLKEVIEDAVTTTAAQEITGPWVTERQLSKEPWCPSRVTLYEMRNSGRLVPGKHFKRKGRFIFYDAAGLKKIFTKKEVAA